MNVLSDVEADGIKVPVFDPPAGAKTGNLPISNGTRVALSCQGAQIIAQVTVIERLGTMFVGRVLGFSPRERSPGGLATGDFIRFRPRDVCRIE